MRRDIAQHARRRFFPVDINFFQQALEALPKIDVTADLNLTVGHDIGRHAPQRQFRKHRNVTRERHIRRAVVVPTQTDPGFGRQHEHLDGIGAPQPQPDYLALEFAQSRKRIGVETQDTIDGLFSQRCEG